MILTFDSFINKKSVSASQQWRVFSVHISVLRAEATVVVGCHLHPILAHVSFSILPDDVCRLSGVFRLLMCNRVPAKEMHLPFSLNQSTFSDTDSLCF